ncbi:hypothetical protein KKF91_15475 [Myxococcota bacterium]|nr:hypothetical protein [Myxococcota bacterium]MBU1431941.1 hypothetical protein [Myxococcota bacterium]MBU1897165.1 hypothetical protein [Myxococcota bacterium]
MHEEKHCSSCRACEAGVCAPDEAAPPPLTGGRFVLASAGVFLLPILLAIIGAIYGGGEADARGQAVGGALGLLLGMLSTSVISLIADRSSPRSQTR